MVFDQATWLMGDETCESPLFRKSFYAKDCVKARIAICGLGFFELYCNGKRVGDDWFVPAWSNYEERDLRALNYPLNDKLTNYRTYYLEYDLLPYLHKGENVLGVWLGNGWYHQNVRHAEGEQPYGFPKLCFSLALTGKDGTKTEIVSDDSVLWHSSEILSNNVYYGEKHDLGLIQKGWSLPGFNDSQWEHAHLALPPQTSFCRQTVPPDRIIRTVEPQLIYRSAEREIYDCKENITGFVVVKCPGNKGQLVRIRHSEELTADRTALDFESAGGEGQIQADEYLCASTPQTSSPHFCWHGFRYFEITGGAEVVSVQVIHADIPVTANFTCSNPVLNWLFETYLRTQLENIHCGVPSDCPHRERLGYTGDGQLTARAAMFCLGARTLYEKWMDDIVDCQDKHTGHIQHTAPLNGGGGGPGGWGGAVYLVPEAYYEMYGDKRFLAKYYPHMRRWLDYMDSRTEDGLIVREEEGGWCLGDWCTPGPIEIPEALVNTYYYIRGLRTVMRFARLLAISEDFEELSHREKASMAAFERAFYDPQTGSFCGGVNGADAFAVDIGAGDERTFANLVAKYSGEGILDTGIFGTDLLIDLLFRRGEAGLAYRLLTERTDASYAGMRDRGATTLWEYWDGKQSHSHPMFGACVRSLFTYVLGIRQVEGTVGFSEPVIEPVEIPGLSWAEGSVMTPHGRISVRVDRNRDGELRFQADCDGHPIKKG